MTKRATFLTLIAALALAAIGACLITAFHDVAQPAPIEKQK